MARRRGRFEGRSTDRPAMSSPERATPAGGAADLRGLREVVAEVVEKAGCDLEALTARRVGRRFLVRVTVDSDTGIDLDQIAELSREIAARLDEVETSGREFVPGEYDLEVGSPGVDRPLTAPRHWRRNRGRLVRVPVAGHGVVVGRVLDADQDGVVLDCDGQSRRFDYQGLGKGKVELEFNRPGEDLDDEGGDEE